MEAVKGATKYVTVDRVARCATCKGSGMQSGRKKETCSVCGGSGVQAITMAGFHMQSTCSACGGTGSAIPPGAACRTCDGVGRVRERKTVEVNIPPGVDQNSKIRVAGAGDAPIKGQGPHGDLFVSLNVSSFPHPQVLLALFAKNNNRFYLHLSSADRIMIYLWMPRFRFIRPYWVVACGYPPSTVMSNLKCPQVLNLEITLLCEDEASNGCAAILEVTK